jgi:hypothetical protein
MGIVSFMGGTVSINTRRALALVVILAMALGLMVLYGAPAQSQEESTGILRVKKLAPDDVNAVFTFRGPDGDFTLKDNESESFVVPVDTTIEITEIDLPDGWILENINCDTEGGTAVVDNNSVTMTLTQANVEFKCNFDNEKPVNPPNTGWLIVEKHSPDVPAQEFQFNIGGAPHSLSDEERVQIQVTRGVEITVTELDPPGEWYLEDIFCDTSGGTATEKTINDFAGGSVTMTVTGTQFECNFDNELKGFEGDPGPPPTTSSTTTSTTTTTTTTTTTLPPPNGDSDTFVDDDGSIFEADIEWLAAEGVTKGCNPPTNNMFCPKQEVTRETMAAFLVRFLGLTADTHGGFKDVSGSNIFKADIEKLATAGITKGCNPPVNDMFCPKESVTRETMAAFLVRALGLTADTHSGFSDVSASNIFKADIEKLATAGITKGCNPPANTLFCPKNTVTRETMAAFLHRAGPLR